MPQVTVASRPRAAAAGGESLALSVSLVKPTRLLRVAQGKLDPLRLLAVCALWPLFAAASDLPRVLPAAGFNVRDLDRRLEAPDQDADEWRRDALARASLWSRPAAPIERADLRRRSGPGGFPEEVVCKFRPDKTRGATPKFDCVFEGGEVLKVKYGVTPEVHTEVAASRLLEALGAGADHMYLVGKLRCFGCPEDPFVMLSCLSSPLESVRDQCRPIYGETTPDGSFQVRVDYGKYVDFTTVAVERRLEGKVMETDDVEGWGWDELDAGTSPRGPRRAEIDALRLLAVFLNNWDNRRDNQRLLCRPGADGRDGACAQPLAYMQDLGATFGRVGGETKAERKLDVEGWRAVPVWKDARACLVAIDSPPLHGATFREAEISESGRRFLAARLGRLRRNQIRDLFEGAGFARYGEASAASRDVEQWVAAFEEKVRQITERPPCPIS
jgi:hypothetical protein